MFKLLSFKYPNFNYLSHQFSITFISGTRCCFSNTGKQGPNYTKAIGVVSSDINQIIDKIQQNPNSISVLKLRDIILRMNTEKFVMTDSQLIFFAELHSIFIDELLFQDFIRFSFMLPSKSTLIPDIVDMCSKIIQTTQVTPKIVSDTLQIFSKHQEFNQLSDLTLQKLSSSIQKGETDLLTGDTIKILSQLSRLQNSRNNIKKLKPLSIRIFLEALNDHVLPKAVRLFTGPQLASCVTLWIHLDGLNNQSPVFNQMKAKLSSEICLAQTTPFIGGKPSSNNIQSYMISSHHFICSEIALGALPVSTFILLVKEYLKRTDIWTPDSFAAVFRVLTTIVTSNFDAKASESTNLHQDGQNIEFKAFEAHLDLLQNLMYASHEGLNRFFHAPPLYPNLKRAEKLEKYRWAAPANYEKCVDQILTSCWDISKRRLERKGQRGVIVRLVSRLGMEISPPQSIANPRDAFPPVRTSLLIFAILERYKWTPPSALDALRRHAASLACFDESLDTTVPNDLFIAGTAGARSLSLLSDPSKIN